MGYTMKRRNCKTRKNITRKTKKTIKSRKSKRGGGFHDNMRTIQNNKELDEIKRNAKLENEDIISLMNQARNLNREEKNDLKDFLESVRYDTQYEKKYNDYMKTQEYNDKIKGCFENNAADNKKINECKIYQLIYLHAKDIIKQINNEYQSETETSRKPQASSLNSMRTWAESKRSQDGYV